MIYLDNSTTTQPSPHVINQMQPYFKRHWQCPTAPYLKGKEPFTSIKESEDVIRSLVGAHSKDTVIFTSSAAEGISHVLEGVYLNQVMRSGKNHILTTPIEDASILMGIQKWEPLGCVTKMGSLNAFGQLTRESLEQSLSPRTELLTLSWANGLTGVIHPIWDLAELCQERGILMHVDASDVLGKLYFRLADIPIDFLTFDGDRIHGPKGSGTLIVRHPQELPPLISDANGKRGGTLNLPALIGLKTACEETEEHFDHLCMETARLRNQLEASLQKALPDAQVLFQEAERLPHVTCIAFPGVPSELLAFHLRQEEIYASFGGGRHQKLEYLLNALGTSPLISKCAISLSLSRFTTEEEVRRVAGSLVDITQKCRTLSEQVVP